MTGRPDSARPEGPVEKDRSLDEVTLFDLLQLFGKLMDETSGGGRRERTIKVDDTPVRVYATRLTDRLRIDTSLLFSDLVKKDAPRQEKIGWFLALLLLLKNETAGCAQEGSFGDIRIFFKGEVPGRGRPPTTSSRSSPVRGLGYEVRSRGADPARLRSSRSTVPPDRTSHWCGSTSTSFAT